MSDTPFEAPADDEPAPAVPPPPNSRPRSLLVVSALSAALGVFGLLGVVIGCGGSLFSLGAGSALTAGMPPEQAAAQMALMQASRPFVFAQLGLFLAIIPLAVGLLIGGVNVLAEKTSGIGWLGNAFLFGLVVEPVRWILQIIQLVALWDETLALTSAAAAPVAGPGMPAGMEHVMNGVVIGSVLLGQAFAMVWFLVKMGIYAWGRGVLASEATQDWVLSKT